MPNPDAAPVPPPEPEAGACCQSGCEPCVYDLYWEAVDRYERALAEWEKSQSVQASPPAAEFRTQASD
jgi:hypothetical protein